MRKDKKKEKGLSALSIIGMTFSLFFLAIGGVLANAWRKGWQEGEEIWNKKKKK